MLSVTLVKEGFEDFKRYLRDKEANGQMYARVCVCVCVCSVSESVLILSVSALISETRVVDMIQL